MGMLVGGISGGVGKFAGGFLPKGFVYEFAGHTAIGGAIGGITAEVYGGDFGKGFILGSTTAAFGYLFNKCMHEGCIGGKLTLSEANRHYREGNGSPLTVDVNTMDLSNVPKLPDSYQVNFDGENFSSTNDALVYGTVTLYPGPNNTVTGGHDYYNFNVQKPWTFNNFLRNVAALLGGIHAGKGMPYIIRFTGTTTLGR